MLGSMICFQRADVAVAFGRNMDKLFNPNENDSQDLGISRGINRSKDWIFTLKCLYATGLNDTRINVQKARRYLFEIVSNHLEDFSRSGS